MRNVAASFFPLVTGDFSKPLSPHIPSFHASRLPVVFAKH
jgi:hypothetical protein